MQRQKNEAKMGKTHLLMWLSSRFFAILGEVREVLFTMILSSSSTHISRSKQGISLHFDSCEQYIP